MIFGWWKGPERENCQGILLFRLGLPKKEPKECKKAEKAARKVYEKEKKERTAKQKRGRAGMTTVTAAAVYKVLFSKFMIVNKF